MVAISGGIFLLERTASLRAQVQQLQAERREFRQQEQDTRRQIQDLRARSEALPAELEQERAARQQIEQVLADRPSPRPVIASVVLSLGVRESGGRKLVIPASAQLVRLQMDARPVDGYSGYRIRVRRLVVIWTCSSCMIHRSRTGRCVGG